MPKKPVVANAIVMTDRADLRSAIRTELRHNGLESDHLHSTKSVKECLGRVERTERAFLVLDWDMGADKVLSVLEANCQGHHIDSHPVFLVSSSDDPNIMQAALEFNVARVHSGEISSADIKQIVRDLLKEAANLGPVRTLLLKCSSHFADSDPQAALDILRPLYEKQKSNTRVALELAEGLMQLKQWEEAEKILEELAEEDKTSARARHQLARCAIKLGQAEKAGKYLKHASLINPLNVTRLLELGDVMLELGDNKAAVQAFDDVMEIAPKNKEAIAGKGKGLLLSGEVNEALTLLRGSANPREVAAIFNTSAVMAIHQQQFDAAIELYKTGVRTVAKHKALTSRLMYNMGIGYVKANDHVKGMKCFKKATDLDPEYQDARHNLEILEKAIASGGKIRPKAQPAASGDSMPPPTQIGVELDKGIIDLGNIEESLGGIGSGPGGTDLTTFSFDDDFDLGIDDDEF